MNTSHRLLDDLEAAQLAPTVIDIEASGFGRGSYPIEIGFVLPDGRGDCMLIRPEASWRHWDPSAEALHHISRDLLARHGQAVADVVDRLEAQLRGRTVYTDGWGHDYTWLATLYDAAGRRPGFRLDSLQKLVTQDGLDHWDATRAAVVRESSTERHRASADARVLQSTVMRLHERIR